MDTTVADPLVGQLLDGRYRVDGRIARGGMATVYSGVDTRLDRRVAVKVMHPVLAEDDAFVARFVREARAAAKLSHPNVVAVYDQGADAGGVFLVMELVRGRTLRDLLEEKGRLTPAQAVGVLEPVLAALQAAHRAGLVHRDVKPENVLLADDGRVKVADFGLARAVEASTLTASIGLLIGTVAYLAPEQVATGAADPRTDVYAAGILLVEMLTGAPPYAGETALSVAYRHLHDDVPPPSTVVPGVPAGLDALAVRATRRDPAARPADAGVFLDELRRAGVDPRTAVHRDTAPLPVGSIDSPAAGLAPAAAGDARRRPVVSRPARRRPVASRPARRPRRHRGVLLAVAIVAVLGLLAAGGGWWLGSGRYTTAPALLGLDGTAAAARADQAGLDVRATRAGAGDYSETVAAGLVLRQRPAPAASIRRGGTVLLTLSRGPERISAPSLTGVDVGVARRRLADAGLRLGAVSERYDDAVAAGLVLDTDPRAGTPLRRDAPVAIVVSKGVQPVAVPDVRMKPLAEAKAALAARAFRVAVVEAFSDTVAAGVVIAQKPLGGTAPKGASVELTVSKGPPLLAVPDVVGQARDDAVAQLTALGLKAVVVAIPGPGKVRSQDPGRDTMVRKGTTVTLYVF